jgi:hypothetical protein
VEFHLQLYQMLHKMSESVIIFVTSFSPPPPMTSKQTARALYNFSTIRKQRKRLHLSIPTLVSYSVLRLLTFRQRTIVRCPITPPRLGTDKYCEVTDSMLSCVTLSCICSQPTPHICPQYTNINTGWIVAMHIRLKMVATQSDWVSIAVSNYTGCFKKSFTMVFQMLLYSEYFDNVYT